MSPVASAADGEEEDAKNDAPANSPPARRAVDNSGAGIGAASGQIAEQPLGYATLYESYPDRVPPAAAPAVDVAEIELRQIEQDEEVAAPPALAAATASPPEQETKKECDLEPPLAAAVAATTPKEEAPSPSEPTGEAPVVALASVELAFERVPDERVRPHAGAVAEAPAAEADDVVAGVRV